MAGHLQGIASKPTLLAACVLAGLATLMVGCEQKAPPPGSPGPPPPAAMPASTPDPATPETTTPGATEPAPAASVETVEDWVLPGTFGPLTTRLELETRFGKDNIREVMLDGAEGIGHYPTLVVFPDDPRRRLELVQDPDNPDAPILEVRVPASNSNWHDASGLRPGMTLAQLVALNGAPVSFYGLDWDYGGAVQDWHGGKLANPVDAKVFRRVSLAARPGAGDVPMPQGDASFRSDDARYPDIGADLVVGEFGISWPNDDD